MGKWQSPARRRELRVAYDDGYAAFNAGKPKSACMYASHLQGYRDWMNGWNDAEYVAKQRATSEAGK